MIYINIKNDIYKYKIEKHINVICYSILHLLFKKNAHCEKPNRVS